MRTSLVVVLVALAACSDKTPPKVDVPPPATTPDDAGVAKTIVVSGVDPSGMHLDDDSPRVVQQQQQPNRPGRPIDVTLRSTPPGAQVAVDGVVIGNTPAYWSGMADGREHQFLFTLRGHGIARYRFVPVSSGVIHARLEPIVEQPDAGVPPPEVVPQPPANIAPPPTVVKPVEQPPAPLLTPDAAVAPSPPTGGVGPQP